MYRFCFVDAVDDQRKIRMHHHQMEMMDGCMHAWARARGCLAGAAHAARCRDRLTSSTSPVRCDDPQVVGFLPGSSVEDDAPKEAKRLRTVPRGVGVAA
jgi:hypothetical protein